MTKTAPFLLTVLTGPNAGASVGFAGGRTRLGGGRDDKIVLAGVPPGAITFSAEGNRLRLIAKAEGLALRDIETGGDRALVASDKVQEFGLPATLRLNHETTVNISRLTPEKLRGTGRMKWLGAGAILLAAGLWLGANLGDSVPPESPGEPSIARLSEVPSAPGPEPVEASPPVEPAAEPVLEQPTEIAAEPASPAETEACDAACLQTRMEGFQLRLDEAGLDGLKIAAEGGVLRVSGTIASDQAATWRDVRARAEAELGQSLPLLVQITEGAPEPVLAIASVWLGKTPEIRTKAGKVLRIGDTTDNGWTVSDISKNGVELKRGERSMNVRF